MILETLYRELQATKERLQELREAKFALMQNRPAWNNQTSTNKIYNGFLTAINIIEVEIEKTENLYNEYYDAIELKEIGA